MQRRAFLQSTVGTALLDAAQAGPSASPGHGIRLGFDTYSLRAFKWKDIQLLDYAAGLKLDTIQISSVDDYESLGPAHLQKVKEHAARVGIKIDGGTGCVCPLSKSWKASQGTPEEYLLNGLKVAKAVGATSMRCFMGSKDDRRGSPGIEACMEATIKVFQAVKEQARDSGVKIALENHAGDMQAREVKTIIEESGKDFVGACLDTGNPLWVVENPMVTMEVLGPYTVTTHVRDCIVFEHPRGAVGQWAALGDGILDFGQLLGRYQQLCPKASMQLEIITGRPPEVLPYLEPDFWKVFEKTPALEFSRFVALAKGGHPFMGTMVVKDAPGEKLPEFTAALREQQRVDLERSLEYAKKSLGVGVRWKG
ncbi:MAG: sugar phosphate isomerase/epimerase [Acidobacteriota bacterium]|nr:sugar phosphate isomerase/epimerase [Acidobacteriota bacterium]